MSTVVCLSLLSGVSISPSAKTNVSTVICLSLLSGVSISPSAKTNVSTVVRVRSV